MHSLLLTPTDVLFFRDGRPMGGASSGHGAAWPLPTVTNAALHAALHRAGLAGLHRHVPGRSSTPRDYSDANRAAKGRLFGALRTVGPFPVCTAGGDSTWFFPRPADAGDDGQAFLHPHVAAAGPSSLPSPCLYPVVSAKPPTKDTPKSWWSEAAWSAYLGSPPHRPLKASRDFKHDTDFSDTEHTYGIGLDPATGTVEEGRFYSASYLRLREHWKLGLLAAAHDKDFRHPQHGSDLIRTLLNGAGAGILVGGQQRHCTATFDPQATARLPLPRGATITGTRVKWVLLSPAIFPAINDHPGGWLPSWIHHHDGRVLLKTGDTERQSKERRDLWRQRVAALPPIAARLVAALVGKPVPVTGWSLGNADEQADEQRLASESSAIAHHESAIRAPGAKPTHLAVPAGAVYYFEAASEPAARALAAALNWHADDTAGTTLRNRRSTLLGEKGFGLGVCGTWTSHLNG